MERRGSFLTGEEEPGGRAAVGDERVDVDDEEEVSMTGWFSGFFSVSFFNGSRRLVMTFRVGIFLFC